MIYLKGPRIIFQGKGASQGVQLKVIQENKAYEQETSERVLTVAPQLFYMLEFQIQKITVNSLFLKIKNKHKRNGLVNKHYEDIIN